jgi:hypothetical protein
LWSAKGRVGGSRGGDVEELKRSSTRDSEEGYGWVDLDRARDCCDGKRPCDRSGPVGMIFLG